MRGVEPGCHTFCHGATFRDRPLKVVDAPATLPVTALVSCDGAYDWVGPVRVVWWLRLVASTIVAEAMKTHVLIRSPRLVNRAWSRLSRPARSLRTRAWRLSHPRCDSIQQWAVSTPGAAVKPVRPRGDRPSPATEHYSVDQPRV